MFQNAQPTTLTSENFIGFAHAAYADGQKATVKTTGSIARNIPQIASASNTLGSKFVFESGSTAIISQTFDSNSNRVVIAYADADDSSKGKAVVGSIDSSDNSITYGTAVEFNSGTTTMVACGFDSDSNKVVIAYSDGGNSYHGTAKVGTVDSSDNRISFKNYTILISIEQPNQF